MRDEIRTRTNLEGFELLHRLADQTRSYTVKVPRDKLVAVLMDLSLMTDKLQEAGYRVTDMEGEAPVPVRVRRRTIAP